MNATGNIVDALIKLTGTDVIDNYNCNRCKQSVVLLKRMSIEKLPNVLTVHLRHFKEYDGEKYVHHVGFGPHFNL